jgi:hypothetical protein
MSHWAEIDEHNQVIRVLVGDNNDPAGDEGYSWLVKNLGGTWIQTSYNSTFRFNYAGVGYTYDPIDDAFIPPIPECGHDELTLNEFKRWECANVGHELP